MKAALLPPPALRDPLVLCRLELVDDPPLLCGGDENVEDGGVEGGGGGWKRAGRVGGGRAGGGIEGGGRVGGRGRGLEVGVGVV